MNPFEPMMEMPRSSSPTTVKDTNREEDAALAPAWQECSFHFGGVRSLLEPFNFEASTTTAKKKRTTCSCSSSCPVQLSLGEESPNPDDEVYHSDVTPKQDAKQYYFGLLSSPAAAVGQQIDLNESAVSFASTTRSKPLKTLQPINSNTNNKQDEENVYHYDVAPKQDEHQYYFGLGQTKKYTTTRYSFPPAIKRVKWTTTTNNNTDEENLYHYDVAPKQDANQYYFGLSAAAAAAAAAAGGGGGGGQVHFEFDDNTANNKALTPKSPSLLADAKSSLSTQDATCWSQ